MIVRQSNPYEVAATLLAGTGTATLASSATGRRAGVLHGRALDGTPLLLTSREQRDPLGMCPGEAHDLAVSLEVRSEAPVPDLSLPRAHLVLHGWVTSVPLPELAAAVGVRCGPLTLGEAYRSWPQPWLLGLDAVEAELHWHAGCTGLDVDLLRATAADPLAGEEPTALLRVDAELGDRLAGLVRAMAVAHDPASDARVPLGGVLGVRAVGIDRYGVDLRCSWPVAAGRPPAVIRLPFPAPVNDAESAIRSLTSLVTAHSGCTQHQACPYR